MTSLEVYEWDKKIKTSYKKNKKRGYILLCFRLQKNMGLVAL